MNRALLDREALNSASSTSTTQLSSTANKVKISDLTKVNIVLSRAKSSHMKLQYLPVEFSNVSIITNNARSFNFQ